MDKIAYKELSDQQKEDVENLMKGLLDRLLDNGTWSVDIHLEVDRGVNGEHLYFISVHGDTHDDGYFEGTIDL